MKSVAQLDLVGITAEPMPVGGIVGISASRRARKLEYGARWRKAHPNRKREWNDKHRDRVKQYERERSSNPVKAEQRRQSSRAWREKNKDLVLVRRRAWDALNPDKCRAMRKRYRNKRYRLDPSYALAKRLKALLRHALKSKAGRRTESLIGCDKAFFAKWISSLFEADMTFSNRSEWHLDHIFPVACCGRNEAQILLAQNYRNLRPMWGHTNHVKSSKLSRESIIAAFLCGITEIHLSKSWQATDSLLRSAERLGFTIYRHYKK